MSGRLSRRTALTGAAALPVALAAQCAAPAHASPDAELIRLSAEMTAAEDALGALLASCKTVEEEHAVDEESTRLGDEIESLGARVRDLPAVTLAGLAAKARATLRTGPCTSGGEPLANDLSDELRITVLEELIALAGLKPAGSAP